MDLYNDSLLRTNCAIFCVLLEPEISFNAKQGYILNFASEKIVEIIIFHFMFLKWTFIPINYV